MGILYNGHVSKISFNGETLWEEVEEMFIGEETDLKYPEGLSFKVDKRSVEKTIDMALQHGWGTPQLQTIVSDETFFPMPEITLKEVLQMNDKLKEIQQEAQRSWNGMEGVCPPVIRRNILYRGYIVTEQIWKNNLRPDTFELCWCLDPFEKLIVSGEKNFLIHKSFTARPGEDSTMLESAYRRVEEAFARTHCPEEGVIYNYKVMGYLENACKDIAETFFPHIRSKEAYEHLRKVTGEINVMLANTPMIDELKEIQKTMNEMSKLTTLQWEDGGGRHLNIKQLPGLGEIPTDADEPTLVVENPKNKV